MRPRTLACTADGVWLWPGIPLTERRGTALVSIPLPHLYQQVAALHGSSVHAPMLARTIARAAACLTRGSVHEADAVLAGAPLPPVSFDGAALMQATGKRLGVSVPDVAVAGWPSASPPELFEQLARVHDRKRPVALALEPVFNPDLCRVAPTNAPFDPTLHPRWPAGQPEGGQFRPRDGAEMVPVQWQGQAARLAARLLARLWRLLRRPPKLPTPSEPTPSPAKPVPGAEGVAPDQPTGIGHNRAPDDGASASSEAESAPKPSAPTANSDQPFTLPVERPPGDGAVAQWGQRAADEIRKALANNDTKRLAEIADALAHAEWIKGQLDNIIAAQDSPRILDDLIEGAQEKGPRQGYDNHHIIEQGPQNGDVPPDIIEAPHNVVRIPRYRHWQINKYYRQPQEECGGLTPRDYLRSKSVQERYAFGLGVLRKFGVLK